MITQNKCDKYWPDGTQTYTYGQNTIKVTLNKTEIFADYMIRTFSVEKVLILIIFKLFSQT